MCSHCGHPQVVHVNAIARARRIDPSGTGDVRVKYVDDIRRRFADLRRLVYKAIVTDDAFGTQGLKVNARFDFDRPADRVDAFMDWLRDMEDGNIFEIQGGTKAGRKGLPWQDKYIKAAYHRGVQRSSNKIAQGGASVESSFITGAFSRPIHADTVALIYTRAFNNLAGIGEAMNARISDVLARAMVEGLGPREVARKLSEVIDGMGRVRAEMLARTEIISASAEATLNTYEEADALGVEVESEFTTAGDGKVCPKCQALEGRVYTIQEARGVLPIHPNCRCAWNPVVRDPSGRVLK